MASGLLPEVYLPDIAGNAASAYAKGYGLGKEMRMDNALSLAGKALTQGDQTGARNALYDGGQVQEGLKLEDHFRQVLRQADADKIAKAQRANDILAEAALAADTPEKWDVLFQTAKRSGLDVDKYQDFGTRSYVLAQGKKTSEWLNMETERRKADAAANKPIEVNGRLVVPQAGGTYREVYSSPPKPEGLREVAPGATVYDPAKGPVFTAPAKPAEKKYEFTKYGIGDPSTGDIKPYAAGNADPELTLEQSKHEQALRKEYTSLSSDMRTIQDSVGKMRKAQTLDSGAGDIAMVYAYMKMLDPTSVVREGEYATAENTGGVPEKVVNIYNKILAGTRLTPTMRDQFVTAGEALAGEKGERFGKLRGQFENIARKSGGDPNRIMLDEGMARKPSTSAGNGDAPAEAVKLLRSDPSPARVQQFDEVFGPGAAQRALGR